MNTQTRINIMAEKGSKRQIQLYVNTAADLLNHAIKQESKIISKIEWETPTEKDNFKERIGLHFLTPKGVPLDDKALRVFWPLRGGPHWDAIAMLRDDATSATPGVLLVEAKSHLREIQGTHCRAKSENGGNRKLIEDTLGKLREFLGANTNAANWMDSKYYQYVNRLAHLRFLHEQGVNAWLANLYFINDRTLLPANQPVANKESWQKKLRKVKEELGLDPETEIHRVVDVYLDALDKNDHACSASAR